MIAAARHLDHRGRQDERRRDESPTRHGHLLRIPADLGARSGAIWARIPEDLGKKSERRDEVFPDRSEATSLRSGGWVIGLGEHPFLLAHRRAANGDDVGVVHQTIADSVGHRRVGKRLMPVFGRDL